MKQYAYSEIFHSIQGEGSYTGVPTAWVRFFLCNLQCDGFGQKDPTNPDTYILPYKNIDIKQYTKLEDLPVWTHGCDSSYSWSAKFKHLQHKATAEEICSRIRQSMYHPSNPEGLFNPRSTGRPHHHLCFTGGEPLMKHAQEAAIEIMDHFYTEKDHPRSITWETNGTQELTSEFIYFFDHYHHHEGEVFFSVSPKLFSVSGETRERAIKPELVQTYYKEVSSRGQLKFVVNGTPEAWKEMEDTIEEFRDYGITYPVWVMGVGATLEGQKGTLPGYCGEAAIATEAFKRGYNYSSRVHVHIWGNTMGT